MPVQCPTVEDTWQLAAAWARTLPGDATVALHGPMGAGKTAFVQGMALGLQVTQRVTSPTFMLVHEYAGRVPLYHFDVYRLTDEEDFYVMGGDEYIGKGVCVLEWPERVAAALPDCFHVYIQPMETGREIRICDAGGREVWP